MVVSRRVAILSATFQAASQPDNRSVICLGHHGPVKTFGVICLQHGNCVGKHAHLAIAVAKLYRSHYIIIVPSYISRYCMFLCMGNSIQCRLSRDTSRFSCCCVYKHRFLSLHCEMPELL